MAIKTFKLIAPTVPGLNYMAIVETDGDYEPMDEFAFTSDRQLYTLKYKGMNGANPRMDIWDMGIPFTDRSLRLIDYEIVDDNNADLFKHEETPPVKDGI